MKVIAEEQEQREPSHLVVLPGGKWALWRCVSLRGTGFPVDTALKLSATESSKLADEVIRRQEAVCEARNQLRDQVNHSLDELRRASLWDDKEKRDPLVRALWQLSNGKLPSADKSLNLEPLHSSQLLLDSAWTHLREAFKIERQQVSGAIQEEVKRDQFREAVIWQNRSAFHLGIQPLAKLPSVENRNSKLRQREETAARYLIRYSTKNETIGFFGPVGWATLSEKSQGLSVRPGAKLLAERNTYFEVWCIDQLAQSLDKLEGMKRWTAPRLDPFVRIEGSVLHLPLKRSLKLSSEQAAILRACDGERTPKEIAALISGGWSGKVTSEREVYEFLEMMESSNLIFWRLEVPMQLHPERTLRRMIERVEDEPLRQRALNAVDEIERARQSVEKACGNPDELDKAIGKLEETFTRLTGASPTRYGGQAYAGRALIFEDCRRDIEVEVGKEIIESLTPTLLLLLTSSRWLTYEVAAKCKTAFRQIYDRLAQQAGGDGIEFSSFWELAQPVIFDRDKGPVTMAARSFQKRWSDVLALPRNQRRVHYDSQQLAPSVLAAFDAPRAGWREARYHSPDIMIAATSAEAVKEGNFSVIMGELHVGCNTIGQALFVEQHPRPEELRQATESDISEPLLCPVISKSNTYLMSARLMPSLMGEKDYWISFTPDPCDAKAKNILRPSDLIITMEADDFKVRSRDGRLEFDLLDVIAADLGINVTDRFKLLPSANHTPRITIDRVVVGRESWSFSPFEMEFAHEKDDVERFVGARKWASSKGIPRFVFVKCPTEIKPLYCDFDSPLCIDMLSKAIRQSSELNSMSAHISMTEMLPDHSEVWLPDAQGQRYASELRIAALDLETRNFSGESDGRIGSGPSL